MLVFGMNEILLASKTQKLNSAVAAVELLFFDLGIKEIVVASNIKKSVAVAADC